MREGGQQDPQLIRETRAVCDGVFCGGWLDASKNGTMDDE